MLENLSVTWGGAGHMIVPVGDLGEVHEELWKLVKIYDADRWAAYVNTHRGRQMADEGAFTDWLTREARRWARKNGGGIAQARKLLTADHIMRHPIGGWPTPPDLTDRLQRETGVSWERGDRVLFSMYKADDGPGQHLVDVTDLDPLPERVRILGTHHLPISLQVLIGMRTGELAPSHLQRLLDRGVTIESVRIDDEDLEFILRLAWLGRQDAGSWSLRQALSEHLGGPSRSAPPYVADDFLETTPLALSRIGCSELSRSHPGGAMPIAVVAGSHPDDFSYAMCLNRCGVPALWLPKEFVSARNRLSITVREALAQCLVEGEHAAVDEPPRLCSTSLGRPMLEGLRDRLVSTTRWGSQLDLEVTDRAELPPYRIPALMDRERYDDPLDVPFSHDEMASGCPVTVPSVVKATDDPWKLTWWVEIDAPRHVLPGRTALNPLTVAESTGWRSIGRCGRDGISFFSHTMGFTVSGSPVEQLLDRPRLRLPLADSVFRALGQSAGLTIEESSAGRYRRLAEELWGGLEEFAADLRDQNRRPFLDAWLSRTRSGVDPGVFTVSNRRFLSLDDAVTASGLPEPEVRAVVDSYLERAILRRGLTLQCQHCRLFEWYELEDVGQTFRCRRCRNETNVTLQSWKGSDREPAFYYDLVEVVYQALRGHAHVPIAALDLLRRDSRSFLHVPEIETTDQNGRKLELDIAAIADGRIVIGEAKSNNKLRDGRREEMTWLRKLSDVAEALTADEVVFATSATEWRTETRERIESVFSGHATEVRILDGV